MERAERLLSSRGVLDNVHSYPQGPVYSCDTPFNVPKTLKPIFDRRRSSGIESIDNRTDHATETNQAHDDQGDTGSRRESWTDNLDRHGHRRCSMGLACVALHNGSNNRKVESINDKEDMTSFDPLSASEAECFRDDIHRYEDFSKKDVDNSNENSNNDNRFVSHRMKIPDKSASELPLSASEAEVFRDDIHIYADLGDSVPLSKNNGYRGNGNTDGTPEQSGNDASKSQRRNSIRFTVDKNDIQISNRTQNNPNVKLTAPNNKADSKSDTTDSDEHSKNDNRIASHRRKISDKNAGQTSKRKQNNPNVKSSTTIASEAEVYRDDIHIYADLGDSVPLSKNNGYRGNENIGRTPEQSGNDVSKSQRQNSTRFTLGKNDSQIPKRKPNNPNVKLTAPNGKADSKSDSPESGVNLNNHNKTALHRRKIPVLVKRQSNDLQRSYKRRPTYSLDEPVAGTRRRTSLKHDVHSDQDHGGAYKRLRPIYREWDQPQLYSRSMDNILQKQNPQFINSDDGLPGGGGRRHVDDDEWEDDDEDTDIELNGDMSLTARADLQQQGKFYLPPWIHQAENSRGKLVTFYKNGDSNFKGVRTAVNKRQFRTFETLLNWLETKIDITSGVRYIFQLPDGKHITDLDQIINGRSYVVSSVRRIHRVPYGDSKERFWSNRAPSGGKLRTTDHDMFMDYKGKRKSKSYPGSRASTLHTVRGNIGFQTSLDVRPRVLTIVCNLERHRKEKVILNPQTTQSYEEMLEDIKSMLKMPRHERISLWTARQPYQKVKGFNHLLRSLRGFDSYFACGSEGKPGEVTDLDENGSPLGGFYDVQPSPRKVKPRTRQPLRKKASNSSYDSPTMAPVYETRPRVYEQSPPHYHSVHPAPPVHEPHIDKIPPKPIHVPPKVKVKDAAMSPISFTPPPFLKSPAPPSADQPLSDFADDVPPPKQPVVNGFMENGHKSPPTSNRYESEPAEAPKPPPAKKSNPDTEVVKVDIHGNPREFYGAKSRKSPDGKRPDQALQLDWVYGYRGRDTRNNLFVLRGGELVYYTASVAVIYDRKNERQRHYCEHTEEITSICLHPNRSKPLVATGQAASPDNPAHVRIWDPHSMSTMCVIGTGVFQNGVSSLGFSTYTDNLGEGSLLIAVDEGEKHVLSLWRWANQKLVAKTTTTSDTVVWGAFHPNDHTIIITFGKQHIYFWKLFWDHTNPDAGGRILRDKKSGVFPEEVPKFVTSLTFAPNGDVLTGDSNGRIMVWSKDDQEAFVVNNPKSEYMRHAHSKSVFALRMCGDGTLLSAGGHDVRAWDANNNFRHIRDKQLPENSGLIRTLVPLDPQSTSHLYVGTTNNIILEGSLSDKFSPVVEGHFEELWAVHPHAEEYSFVTAGFDQFVVKWNILKHRVMWKVNVEKPCLSVALDPEGRLVVVGTTVGRVIVLNALTGQHIASLQVGNEQLDAISFSPNGKLLAMGSHDCNIYIYSIEDEGQVLHRYKTCVLRGHRNFVMQLDWSRDSSHIQTVSGDYDLMFWDVENMQKMEAQAAKDIEWATNTCILGYNVLGAWSNLQSASDDINTLHRSSNKDVLAVGDNKGGIRLYKYPCTADNPYSNKLKVYTGHVTNVRFTFNDAYLITSGGVDAGLMQWKVVDGNTR